MTEIDQEELDPTNAELEEEDEQWGHAEAPQARPVDYERLKRWVIQRDGKDYIQYSGLLDYLHQVSKGNFCITTKLEQAPTAANGMMAIVSAVVSLGQGGPDDRTASGIGDAAPDSVNRMMAPHLCRMAETRAKGRALRDLLNVPYVTTEELGPSGGAGASAGGSGKQDTENLNGIVIAGTRYTREEVWKAYQGRMTQMRDAKLPIPQGCALGGNAPLSQLAGATQRLKKALAEAGKLPATNGRSN